MRNLNPHKIVSVRKNGTMRVHTVNDLPTKTQQQYTDECDINNIMKKYSDTGEFRNLTSRQGVYADFSKITDYQDMLHQISYAQEAFASLPAQVRAKFQNDPGSLLTFLQDRNNYDEGVKLGLIEPKPGQTKTPTNNDESNNDDKGVKQKLQKGSQPQKNSTVVHDGE